MLIKALQWELIKTYFVLQYLPTFVSNT